MSRKRSSRADDSCPFDGNSENHRLESDDFHDGPQCSCSDSSFTDGSSASSSSTATGDIECIGDLYIPCPPNLTVTIMDPPDETPMETFCDKQPKENCLGSPRGKSDIYCGPASSGKKSPKKENKCSCPPPVEKQIICCPPIADTNQLERSKQSKRDTKKTKQDSCGPMKRKTVSRKTNAMPKPDCAECLAALNQKKSKKRKSDSCGEEKPQKKNRNPRNSDQWEDDEICNDCGRPQPCGCNEAAEKNENEHSDLDVLDSPTAKCAKQPVVKCDVCRKPKATSCAPSMTVDPCNKCKSDPCKCQKNSAEKSDSSGRSGSRKSKEGPAEKVVCCSKSEACECNQKPVDKTRVPTKPCGRCDACQKVDLKPSGKCDVCKKPQPCPCPKPPKKITNSCDVCKKPVPCGCEKR